MGEQNRKIGLGHAVALVAGNMIGSGIFLLPATLAPFGGFSLWGWALSSAGALLLALTFARLSRLLPHTGGPYLYTRAAYGPFPGFLVAWGYWISMWTGNAAIVIAFVSNLTPFLPGLRESPALAAGACLSTTWLLTGLNLLGVREAANFQLWTTILRLAPIILIASLGFAHFDGENLNALGAGLDPLQATLQTAALTLWSFLGVESATIPAADISRPQRNVARATLIGTVLSAVVFVAACTAVMGILPPDVLPNTAAPFADAARLLWGEAGYYLVAGAAAIACLGALNGWILLQGQVPWAAARDGLFPAFLGRHNGRGVPARALLLSSFLLSFMILLNYTQTLQRQFEQMILLATLSSLIPYLFCSFAEWFLRRGGKRSAGLLLLSVLTLAFVGAAIAGIGKTTILAGLLLLAAGLPVFAWQRWRTSPALSFMGKQQANSGNEDASAGH